MLQLHAHALGLATSQRQCRVPHAHHEGIAPGARLRQDFDVLAGHEAQLEEPPLERGEPRTGCADSYHATARTGGQRREARKVTLSGEISEGASGRNGGSSVHGRQYE